MGRSSLASKAAHLKVVVKLRWLVQLQVDASIVLMNLVLNKQILPTNKGRAILSGDEVMRAIRSLMCSPSLKSEVAQHLQCVGWL